MEQKKGLWGDRNVLIWIVTWVYELVETTLWTRKM